MARPTDTERGARIALGIAVMRAVQPDLFNDAPDEGVLERNSRSRRAAARRVPGASGGVCMSLNDWIITGLSVACALSGWNVLTLQRIVERQHLQVRRLTRRVWILEGCPHHDCEAGEGQQA